MKMIGYLFDTFIRAVFNVKFINCVNLAVNQVYCAFPEKIPSLGGMDIFWKYYTLNLDITDYK